MRRPSPAVGDSRNGARGGAHGACRGPHGRMHTLGGLGAQPRARGHVPPGRGARLRPLGNPQGGTSVHGQERQGEQHPALEGLRARAQAEALRPQARPKPQRLRARRPRIGQDALLRQAQPHAGKRRLPRHRSQGNPPRRCRLDARGRRIRHTHLRHDRLLPLDALQPAFIREGPGRHPRLRGVPDQEHHARRPQGVGPLLGELRAPALHGAGGLPRLPRATRGEGPQLPHAATEPRGGARGGRVLHEPARPHIRGARDGHALHGARARARGAGRAPLRRRGRLGLGPHRRAPRPGGGLRAVELPCLQGGGREDPEVDHH